MTGVVVVRVRVWVREGVREYRGQRGQTPFANSRAQCANLQQSDREGTPNQRALVSKGSCTPSSDQKSVSRDSAWTVGLVIQSAAVCSSGSSDRPFPWNWRTVGDTLINSYRDTMGQRGIIRRGLPWRHRQKGRERNRRGRMGGKSNGVDGKGNRLTVAEIEKERKKDRER